MKHILLRIITVILLVALIGALCSCGSTDEPSGKPENSSKTSEQSQISEQPDDNQSAGEEIIDEDEDPDAPYEDPFDSKKAKPLDSGGSLNTMDIVTFGSYKQNSSGSDNKPIEWIVLKVESNKALLLSRYVLDTVQYHSDYKTVSWELCTLRKWLTEEFAPEAFGSDISRLVGTATPADKNPSFDTDQGGNTSDNIFLMSAVEVSNAAYGFEKYDVMEDAIRMARATDYAKAKGCFVAEGGRFNGYANWWLRTMGSNTKQTAYIYSDGSVCTVGAYTIHKDVGVRPAIWVSI